MGEQDKLYKALKEVSVVLDYTTINNIKIIMV